MPNSIYGVAGSFRALVAATRRPAFVRACSSLVLPSDFPMSFGKLTHLVRDIDADGNYRRVTSMMNTYSGLMYIPNHETDIDESQLRAIITQCATLTVPVCLYVTSKQADQIAQIVFGNTPSKSVAVLTPQHDNTQSTKPPTESFFPSKGKNTLDERVPIGFLCKLKDGIRVVTQPVYNTNTDTFLALAEDTINKRPQQAHNPALR